MPTVLVVDDERTNRLLLRTLLQHAGYRVTEAADVEQAWRALEEHVDLAIVDLSLPGGGGATLLRKMRSDGRLRGVPVALYTATRSDAILEDFIRTFEVAAIIPKPGEPEAILAAIETAFRHRSSP